MLEGVHTVPPSRRKDSSSDVLIGCHSCVAAMLWPLGRRLRQEVSTSHPSRQQLAAAAHQDHLGASTARTRVALSHPSAGRVLIGRAFYFRSHRAKSQRPRQQTPKGVWRGPGGGSDESQAAHLVPTFLSPRRRPDPVTPTHTHDPRATASKGKRQSDVVVASTRPISSLPYLAPHRQKPSLPTLSFNVDIIALDPRPSAPQQLIATLPVYY
jgi:hypothetical protein